jgi:hypothetical protein
MIESISDDLLRCYIPSSGMADNLVQGFVKNALENVNGGVVHFAEVV